jgi:hypothetical protein
MSGTEIDGNATRNTAATFPSQPGGLAAADLSPDISEAQRRRDFLCTTMHSFEYLEPEQIDAILADREFFLPWLRATLRRRVETGFVRDEDGYLDMADFHAIFLLAQFGDAASISDILACFAADGEVLWDAYSDALTEDMWQPIARLAPDTLDVVLDFLATTELDRLARGAIIRGLLAMAVLRPDRRARVTEFVARIVMDGALSTAELAGILYTCGEFDLHELRDQAFAFADAVQRDALPVDEGDIEMDEIRESFTGAIHDVAQARLHDDVYTLNRRWEQWNQPPGDDAWPSDAEISDELEQRYHERLPIPIRHEPKTGRNDPCPCGSGKKFKKCCWKP